MPGTRVILWLFFALPCLALPPAPTFLLPDEVVPKRHIVDLTIDPNQPAFEGRVRIEVELRKPATVIWVNARNVVPREASVEHHGEVIRARAETARGEFLGLVLPSPLEAGRAILSINYKGRLDEKALGGPFRRPVGGDWYVFTTFTPIDARRAFPCFDEPRFKTPWELTIHVKRELKAFANAPMIGEVDEANGMKAVQFAATEPLPAEVVAFAVGPFDVFESARAGYDTPIRVITPKGRAAEGKAAAQASLDVLPRLEAYTGTPYAFGKLDHVALPDSAFGAVENPGLITYIARRLLLAPGEETAGKTSAIRSVEAHEIGHQWFGNLVTQATWEDVWLSEGFATWLSTKVMDEEQPAPRKRLGAVGIRELAMIFDSGPHSRPVRVAMTSRKDLRGVYHRIVYDKGAAILLMLDGWLGEDRIREGLRTYLREHRFGNATTVDLAAALRKASGIDVTPVLNTFLDQTGVPTVQAAVRCDSKPRLEISQVNSTGQWAIPVCWKAGTAGSGCTVLDAPKREIELPACPSWTYLNSGGTGYYRTGGSPAQLAALADSGLGQLTAPERLTLVYDLRALKRAGRADVSHLLGTLASDPEPEIARAASLALQPK